jgi:branched-chain amino acid transport system permease protein
MTFNPGKYWGTRLLSLLLVAGVVAGLQYGILPMLDGYDSRLIVLSLLFASLAVSLNMINGITGQFSIGHAAFYLIGAYTTGRLTMSLFPQMHISPGIWLIMMCIVGAIAAGIAGFIVGLPSLRLRGDYLAIVTLGFGEIARIVVQNQDGKALSFWGLDLGGAFGLTVKPQLTQVAHAALLLIFTIAVSRNLLKTAQGLSFLAVREDEIAAEATGVNTTATKITAFVIGAALAGMTGALFSHYEGFISPTHFDMNASFIIVAMVVIGGTGSITGSAVAGIVLTLLQEALRKVQSIAAIDLIAYILGAIVIAVAVSQLKPMVRMHKSAGLKKTLAGFGLLGCVGALAAVFFLAKMDMATVIKAGIITLLIGLVLALTVQRGRKGLPAFGLVVLAIIADILLRPIFAVGLHAVPFIQKNLGTTEYSPSNLRMAIFALALVVVMLVKPQGMFGHHEFSWDWLKGLFKRPHREEEIAA